MMANRCCKAANGVDGVISTIPSALTRVVVDSPNADWGRVVGHVRIDEHPKRIIVVAVRRRPAPRLGNGLGTRRVQRFSRRQQAERQNPHAVLQP